MKTPNSGYGSSYWKIKLEVEVVRTRGTPLSEWNIDFLCGTKDLLLLRLRPRGGTGLELLQYWLVATGSLLLK